MVGAFLITRPCILPKVCYSHAHSMYVRTPSADRNWLWSAIEPIPNHLCLHCNAIHPMNVCEGILTVRCGLMFTRLPYVCLSSVFPGVCFFFFCTDSSSICTCVCLLACTLTLSLPLASLFDMGLFTPLYLSRREMLVPSCRTLLKPDRISSNPLPE